MTWFEHLKYRWKFSRCKTTFDVLKILCTDLLEYNPMEITKDTDIKSLIKKYSDRNEENCANCKWLGLFMTTKEHYFTCRRYNYMVKKCSLGTWCGEWEKNEEEW